MLKEKDGKELLEKMLVVILQLGALPHVHSLLL